MLFAVWARANVYTMMFVARCHRSAYVCTRMYACYIYVELKYNYALVLILHGSDSAARPPPRGRGATRLIFALCHSVIMVPSGTMQTLACVATRPISAGCHCSCR